MIYISSDVIVNEVKNRLATYFSSNKIDESVFPRVIRKCVGQMGLKIYPEKCKVIEVVNCKAKLPDDFKLMCLALSCERKVDYYVDQRKWSVAQKIVCELDVCQTECDVCYNECGNMFRVVQYVDLEPMVYEKFNLLRPTSKCKPNCYNGSLNFASKSNDEFEIKEERGQKYLYTNIKDSIVYIEYLSDLEHEDHFEIPDNENIKDWIFEELRQEAYAYLYDNGEEVLQKLNESKGQLAWKWANAIQVYRRSEVSDYYNVANSLAKRYRHMAEQIRC